MDDVSDGLRPPGSAATARGEMARRAHDFDWSATPLGPGRPGLRA